MDSNNNHFEQEKRNEAHNISSDWQTHDSNLANTSLTYANPVALYKGNPLEASSSSSPMLNSFCTSVWDHSLNTLNMGPFNTNNLQNATTDLNTMGWSQFPADSGFIERAARFSCFGRENFGVINPYGGLERTNIPYDRVCSTNVMHQPKEVLPETELKSVSSEKSPKYEQTPLKNEEKSNNFGKSSEKGKRGVLVSRDESDETEFSGGGREPSSSKSKKRKRRVQGNKLGEADGLSQPGGDFTEDNKGDQCSTLISSANDTPKEGYIHMRARRGQATNSHSLAERVRREKISERMKLLQDLVPGCSKVTGKASMLDEIINYVQLLQGQVEFLSMKLATVNPCLDFNLEGLLKKDILQSRSGPSSLLGYSPDITTMQLPSYDALRRSISSQLTAMSEGYKQPVQVPGMWVDDELHNVVQMGLNSSAPLDFQDLNGSLP